MESRSFSLGVGIKESLEALCKGTAGGSTCGCRTRMLTCKDTQPTNSGHRSRPTLSYSQDKEGHEPELCNLFSTVLYSPGTQLSLLLASFLLTVLLDACVLEKQVSKGKTDRCLQRASLLYPHSQPITKHLKPPTCSAWSTPPKNTPP